MIPQIQGMDVQIQDMKSKWPRFRLNSRYKQSRVLAWSGELEPQYQVYKVEVIVDFSPAITPKKPIIRVLSPVLDRLPGNPEGELPHVYWGEAGNFSLCLYDPNVGEWNSKMLVSDTLVPWTIDWLACYEGWLLTGQWNGGGRHDTRITNERR